MFRPFLGVCVCVLYLFYTLSTYVNCSRTHTYIPSEEVPALFLSDLLNTVTVRECLLWFTCTNHPCRG